MAGIGNNDLLVIRTEDLARVIREWIRRHELEHPIDQPYNLKQDAKFDERGKWSGVEYREEHWHTGGIRYLSEHSGVDDRKIRGILLIEYKTTSLYVADRIISAMEETYKLTNGELEIIPNPRLTQEKWIEHMRERGCI
jgi:hypothetical protein